MAYGYCFILGKCLPHHCRKQIQMMAQNQIRPEAFHRLPCFLQKYTLEYVHHILLSSGCIWCSHKASHPTYPRWERAGFLFCNIPDRHGPFGKMHLVLLIDPCHHGLFMPQCGKPLYQTGKINTAPVLWGFWAVMLSILIIPSISSLSCKIRLI